MEKIMNDEKISKILDKMDHNFVDNYEDMSKYKKNLDDMLINLGFKPFKSYNNFCIKIKENTTNYIKKEKKYISVDDLDNEFFSIIMNKTIRDKIRENKNYEKKLSIYFNIDDTKDLIKPDKY